MRKRREIQPVKDNTEKQETYRILNSKCKKALDDKEYETVVLLTYSMIEDRLLSFLHYMYIIDRNKNPLLPTDYIDSIIRPLLEFKADSPKNRVYRIYNISTKIKILKLFSKKYSNEQYLNDCYQIIDKNIGIDNYQKYFLDLNKWINVRNEIIHASFNKEIADLAKKTEQCAREGYRLARIISRYTNLIKTRKNEQISIQDKYKEIERQNRRL